MSRKFLTAIDLEQNELQNAVLHKQTGLPAGAKPGQVWFDPVTGKLNYADKDSALVDPTERSKHWGTQLAATISDLDTTVKAYTLDTFAAPAGAVDFAGQPVTGIGDYTDDDSAAVNYRSMDAKFAAADTDIREYIDTQDTALNTALTDLETDLQGQIDAAGVVAAGSSYYKGGQPEVILGIPADVAVLTNGAGALEIDGVAIADKVVLLAVDVDATFTTGRYIATAAGPWVKYADAPGGSPDGEHELVYIKAGIYAGQTFQRRAALDPVTNWLWAPINSGYIADELEKTALAGRDFTAAKPIPASLLVTEAVPQNVLDNGSGVGYLIDGVACDNKIVLLTNPAGPTGRHIAYTDKAWESFESVTNGSIKDTAFEIVFIDEGETHKGETWQRQGDTIWKLLNGDVTAAAIEAAKKEAISSSYAKGPPGQLLATELIAQNFIDTGAAALVIDGESAAGKVVLLTNEAGPTGRYIANAAAAWQSIDDATDGTITDGAFEIVQIIGGATHKDETWQNSPDGWHLLNGGISTKLDTDLRAYVDQEILALDTSIAARPLNQIAAPQNSVDMVGYRLINLGPSIDATDAVTRGEVDALRNGTDWKDSVRVKSVGADILPNGLQLIDGYQLEEDDRVFLNDQTDATENLIWRAHAGDWTIDPQSAQGALSPAAALMVETGTYAGTQWRVTQPGNTITVGATELHWVQFGAAAAMTASTGVKLVGNDIQAEANIGRFFTTTVGDGATTDITVNHNLGTKAVIVSVFTTAEGEDVECTIRRPSATQVMLGFTTAPLAGALTCVVGGGLL